MKTRKTDIDGDADALHDPDHLKLLLQKAEPALRLYVAQLQAENARLQRRIAALEVKDLSSKNHIAALKQEVEELLKAEKVVWARRRKNIAAAEAAMFPESDS